MKTLTTKQMKQKINDKMESLPGKEIRPGINVEKIGYKYVTVLDIWDETTIEKIDIADFYNQYVRYR